MSKKILLIILMALMLGLAGCAKTQNIQEAAVPEPTLTVLAFEWDETLKRANLEDNACYWEERFQEAVTEEKFYEYEIKTDETGTKYAALKGFKKEFQTDFIENLRRFTKNSWSIYFPETLEGIPVKEISAYAFQNIDLGSYCTSLKLSDELLFLGEHCFENCGIKNVIFDRKTAGQSALVIGDGCFADNEGLWGVYINDTETHFGTDVFAGCAEKYIYAIMPNQNLPIINFFNLQKKIIWKL